MESLIALPTHHEPTKKPNRHGQPWVMSDYELMVQGVRDGLELPSLASRIGRAENVLLPRLRRLLPAAQRECYPELVLDALRTALADDTYDWRHEMLLSPPIIRNEIVRSGWTASATTRWSPSPTRCWSAVAPRNPRCSISSPNVSPPTA